MSEGLNSGVVAVELRKAAEAIWAIQREDLDKCDLELDDVGDHYDTFKMAKAAIAAMPGASEGEVFAYYVEQRLAEPAFLRKPAYIPEPSELRTVTALYAHPAPSDQEKLADLLTKAVGDITAALTMAGKQAAVAAWAKPYVDALNEHDARARQTTPAVSGEG